MFWMKYWEKGNTLLPMHIVARPPRKSPIWNHSYTLAPLSAATAPLPETKPHAYSAPPLFTVIAAPVFSQR